ncbi:MAG: hypothetical protein QM534_00520 [Sediminibacterium sp.]|nr:hypothetical protein [Sediminibacterium sp.]
MSIRFYHIVIVLLLFSCSGKNETNAENYRSEVIGDEALIRYTELKDLKFSCRYRPTDEMILSEIQSNKVANEDVQSLRKKYRDMVYFSFCITTPSGDEISGIKGNASYYQLLDYLNNSMQADFYLIGKSDTVPCVGYHYERSFDVSSVNYINLGFPSRNFLDTITHNLKTDMQLVYDDKILGMGMLHFRFNKNDINKLPKLNYERD